MSQTKVINLKTIPVGLPQVSDFELITEEVPTLRPGEVLLKALYISVEPLSARPHVGDEGASLRARATNCF
jgi:NADPH-dependent curcumin reductase CurA